MLLDSEELVAQLIALDRVAFADTSHLSSDLNLERSILFSIVSSEPLTSALSSSGAKRFGVVVLQGLGNLSGLYSVSDVNSPSFVPKRVPLTIASEVDTQLTTVGSSNPILASRVAAEKSALVKLLEYIGLSDSRVFLTTLRDKVLANLGFATVVVVVIEYENGHGSPSLSPCSTALSSEWNAVSTKLRTGLLGVRNEVYLRELLDRDYRQDWEVGVAGAGAVLSAIENEYGTAARQVSTDGPKEVSPLLDQGYGFGAKYRSLMEEALRETGLGESFEIQFGNRNDGTLEDTDWGGEHFSFTCDARGSSLVSRRSMRYSGWFCESVDEVLNCLVKSFRLLRLEKKKGGLILVVPTELLAAHHPSLQNIGTVNGLEVIPIRRQV